MLRDPDGYNTSGKLVWSSGWLPALYQGIEVSAMGNAGPSSEPGPADPRRPPAGTSSNCSPRSNAEHARDPPA